MAKVVTMGELLLRLLTSNNEKFIQANKFEAFYGGSEANVAISLANFGFDSEYITKVPNNPIGKSAISFLRKYNVNVSNVAYGGERLGIYFMEKGSALRPSNVVYDRKESSISKATVSDFDFNKIFKNADWFHFSGITPAVSKECRELLLEALKVAKKQDVIVSCDLNYRKKMWTFDEARSVMPKYMEYVDVLIGGREDIGKMLGHEKKLADENDNPLLKEYDNLFKEVVQKYNFKYVVNSLRKSNTSSYNELSGCISNGKAFYNGTNYEIAPMVDRVGGGDAFAAGIIAGLLMGKSMQDTLEFAIAASVLKHTIPGDANMVSIEEVDNLIKGKGTGRVQR